MKLINLHEDVVDLDKKRRQKAIENQPFSIDDILGNIDDTIEVTIEYLVQKMGWKENDARSAVLQHLSDLVMGNDLRS